jgi:archaellum biogenesis protein FlaJ (TadC family)
MIDDISNILREKVLEALSDKEKIELNKKEADELFRLHPEYAIEYFKSGFINKNKHVKKK